jgi:anthranilate synthase/indole-3-glycerol phosphate synthase/phosphoribosylanthranilate isomerase
LLVGVFQDAPLSHVLRIVSEVQLDVVQLHGSEPIEWAQHIPVPVIRVFHVGKSGMGVQNISRGGAHAFVLLDGLRDDGSRLSGGAGKIFDWDVAKKIVDDGEIVVDGFSAYTQSSLAKSTTASDQVGATAPSDAKAPEDTRGVAPPSAFPLPIILAGGLTPSNVAAAIERVQPWAVDVSGGVELADGSGKDIQKVKAFIQNAKGLLLSEEEEVDEEDAEVKEGGEEEENIYEEN